MNFGVRLKQLRNSKDLKQSDLADIFCISASAIGSYERCERQPTFELLKKYAKYFNVSIDYILCNSDEQITTDEYIRLTSFDLLELFSKHEITLDGIKLTKEDKRRILDISTVLLFDKLK